MGFDMVHGWRHMGGGNIGVVVGEAYAFEGKGVVSCGVLVC